MTSFARRRALLPSQLLESDRQNALERFRETPSGHEKPSRYWKYDLETLDVPLPEGTPGGSVEIDAPLVSLLMQDATPSLEVDARDTRAGDKGVHYVDANAGQTRDCLDPWRIAFNTPSGMQIR